LKSLTELKTAIYADGADKASMQELYRKPYIKGFTTNPTLMRKAGVKDYSAFAMDVIEAIPDRPISFEVLSDDFDEMVRQGRLISGWGKNVFVKIPIMNSLHEYSLHVMERLATEGIRINATALMSLDQVIKVRSCLAAGPECYLSIMAGRIADSGRDPLPIMTAAVELLAPYPNLKLLWASPREILNIFHADSIGCPIITVTHDLLQKLPLIGKDLEEFSLETVQMFQRDAMQAGYFI
jgi:transaldolase